jgi:DNA polymerase-4
VLLDVTRDATAGLAEASKLVASAEEPGMRGSVCDGKPGAIALTVELAEAEAEALPEAEGRAEAVGVADEEAEPVDVGLEGDPAEDPLQAVMVSAAAASAVIAASRIGRVMSAIGGRAPSDVDDEDVDSLVGGLGGTRRRQRPRTLSAAGPAAAYDGCVQTQDDDARPEPLEAQRRRGILHVDMDAFFVAVEQRERPELRGRRVIVGFPAERSVVLSASYEARAFGVRSAMPMLVALRRCPDAIVVEPRHRLYYDVSAQLMAAFGDYTDLVEPLSVDEAFLDVSGAVRRLHAAPEEIAAQIKARIRADLGITASVGVAATKFVAKIASARSKPDGLLVVRPEDTVAFLHALPVGALWGIGGKTQEVLARLGIHTVADLAHTPDSTLRRALGATGLHAKRLSWGVDERRVTPARREKSIGAEETFGTDVADDAALHAELLRLAHRVAGRMRGQGLAAGTVALKLRYSDFSTLARSRTLPVPTDSAQQLYSAARQLLSGLGERPMPVRLIGLRGERLERSADAPRQLSLDRSEDNWRTAEEALDRVSERFGTGIIQPARLLEERRAGRSRPSRE